MISVKTLRLAALSPPSVLPGERTHISSLAVSSCAHGTKQTHYQESTVSPSTQRCESEKWEGVGDVDVGTRHQIPFTLNVVSDRWTPAVHGPQRMNPMALQATRCAFSATMPQLSLLLIRLKALVCEK